MRLAAGWSLVTRVVVYSKISRRVSTPPRAGRREVSRTLPLALMRIRPGIGEPLFVRANL
jgi:hypothetical protein